jgi:hypothetical protein
MKRHVLIVHYLKPAKSTDETYLSSSPVVARLPDPFINNVFTLQCNPVKCLNTTTAMELRLCQQLGKIAETLPELEELHEWMTATLYF